MDITKLQSHLPTSIYQQLPQAMTFGIDGPKRISNFLGQCKHECQDFTHFEENLNYSVQALMNTWPKRFPTQQVADSYARQPEKIANYVYANRLGNGDEQSGDGWKHRGMGCIQLTGKDNHQDFFKAIGLPADSDPHLIATTYPLVSAAWFFKINNLWAICDKGVDYATANGAPTGPIVELTKRINGGLLGLQERVHYTQEFYRILTT